MKKNYWIIRAENYDNLKWVQDKYLLNQLIKFCSFKKTDIVHEVGAGTGVIAKAIIPKVKQVVASDNALDMIAQLHGEKIITMLMDLETKTPFKNDFDKIIARMVFHHITKLTQTTKNCYDMLKRNGELIIQEGIPPTSDKKVIKWYSDTMGLKEKRHTFSGIQLSKLLLNAGFVKIKRKIIIDKNFSVLNWLKNSGQDMKTLKKIYEVHKNAPLWIKKAYKMRLKKNGDIILQTKVLLIKGQKI